MIIRTIRKEFYDQLLKIEPSHGEQIDYRPCKVTMLNGEVFNRVYMHEASSSHQYFTRWPDETSEIPYLLIENVQKIEESPVRLPPDLANKMYKAGESSMGGSVFTLVLQNGKKLPFSSGNSIDFPNLPPGITPSMVKDLLPHVGKEVFRDREPKEFESGARYYWCLFADPKIYGHDTTAGFDTKNL